MLSEEISEEKEGRLALVYDRSDSQKCSLPLKTDSLRPSLKSASEQNMTRSSTRFRMRSVSMMNLVGSALVVRPSVLA